MMNVKRIACATLLLATSVTHAAAQTPDQAVQIRSAVQQRLDSLHAAATFPGATAAIVLPNGTALTFAVGFADTTTREKMAPSHRMLQGSVGKTYFAAVALQLVREGKLDLDRPVSHYLGGEPWWLSAVGKPRLPNGAAVTVRDLMMHRSGVVRYEFKEEFYRDLAKDPLRTWTPPERLAYILDTEPPFAAAQGWEYSDTNYILLGMILEKITGRAVYQEVQERILKPHALTNTIPSDRIVLPGVSQGYAGANNPFGGSDAMIRDGRFTVNPQLEWTGGGFASTTEDLARWGALVYAGSVFGDSLLTAAVAGVEAPQLGRGARYGLGVIVRDTPLGVSYGHSGFFPGYLTELRYYPQSRMSVAVQFNTSVGRAIGRGGPAGVLQDIANIAAAILNAR